MPIEENDYALVVGINDYLSKADLKPLSHAVSDADELEKWLLNKDTGGGLPDGNCKKIISQPGSGKPVHAEIDDAIDAILNLARQRKTPARRFYFYFSGHGMAARLDQAYLCLPKWSDYRRNMAIDSYDYWQMLANTGLFREIVCLFDCCRSYKPNVGGIGSTLWSGKPEQSAPKARLFLGFAAELMERAFEENGTEGHGYFTRALLSALQGGACREEGGVPASKLKDFLEEETPRLAETDGKIQNPVVANSFQTKGEPVFGSARPLGSVPVSAEQKIAAPIPAWKTSANYQGPESSHEYYRFPAAEYSHKTTTRALEGESSVDSGVFIFIRARDRDSYAKGEVNLRQAAALLQFESAERKTIPLADHSEIHPHGWLAFSVNVAAGDYLLHDLGEERRTTPIAVYPKLQTQLFLTFDRRVLHRTLFVSLAPPDRGVLPDDDWARAVDLGLAALSGGSGMPPFDAREILRNQKFENPMLGLVAAWAALRNDLVGDTFDKTLDGLEASLPGSPDVAALRVAHARRQGLKGPKILSQQVSRIPMLRAATSELISAAGDHLAILADDNHLDDVSPRLYADSPFTSWQTAAGDLPERLQHGPTTKREAEARSPSPIQDLWLQETMADVIETESRRNIRLSAESFLGPVELAKRTGVTPNAVRKALEIAPLANVRIAMSLSDARLGGTESEGNDATIYVARTLIAAGATLAYGGDFRKGGYTELLAQVIKAYNHAAGREPQFLHCYIGATNDGKSAPADLPLEIHHLVDSPEVARDALMPPPSATEKHSSGLYFSDMRRVMPRHTFGRILLGGKTRPLTPGVSGYGGLYPGVIEEAWRTLEARQPLYVAGGFGGAAAVVADLLEGKVRPEEVEERILPPELKDESSAASKFYRENAETILKSPYREKLGLPAGLKDLADALCKLGLPHLTNGDEESVRWNGLTIAENHDLFRTRDPERLAVLILKGLTSVAHR